MQNCTMIQDLNTYAPALNPNSWFYEYEYVWVYPSFVLKTVHPLIKRISVLLLLSHRIQYGTNTQKRTHMLATTSTHWLAGYNRSVSQMTWDCTCWPAFSSMSINVCIHVSWSWSGTHLFSVLGVAFWEFCQNSHGLTHLWAVHFLFVFVLLLMVACCFI